MAGNREVKAVQKNKYDKVVQGAWISRDDQNILKKEVAKQGIRSTSTLAGIIIRNYCDQKRLEEANEMIDSMKKRERNGETKEGSESGSQEEKD